MICGKLPHQCQSKFEVPAARNKGGDGPVCRGAPSHKVTGMEKRGGVPKEKNYVNVGKLRKKLTSKLLESDRQWTKKKEKAEGSQGKRKKIHECERRHKPLRPFCQIKRVLQISKNPLGGGGSWGGHRRTKLPQKKTQGGKNKEKVAWGGRKLQA